MSKDRYEVLKGSQSCHCCFEATIVDKTKPVMIHGKHYDDQYEAVCECFDLKSAEMIAEVLNASGVVYE